MFMFPFAPQSFSVKLNSEQELPQCLIEANAQGYTVSSIKQNKSSITVQFKKTN